LSNTKPLDVALLERPQPFVAVTRVAYRVPDTRDRAGGKHALRLVATTTIDCTTVPVAVATNVASILTIPDTLSSTVNATHAVPGAFENSTSMTAPWIRVSDGIPENTGGVPSTVTTLLEYAIADRPTASVDLIATVYLPSPTAGESSNVAK
jgi:hypothetical protein